MRHQITQFIIPILLLLVCILSEAAFGQNSVARSLDFDGRKRSYLLHLPPTYRIDTPSELVFVFHGGKGDGRQAEEFSGFSSLADEQGFIVVYPDAVKGQWNDGRGVRRFHSHKKKIDDVGFVLALIDTLQAEYNVNPRGIFITGASNGAMFCNRLAAEAPERFSAMAAVIGSMAKPIAKDFNPTQPIPVLIMNGTEDPLVPFQGGGVGFLGFRGKVIGVEACVQKWVVHNQCDEPTEILELPDIDPEDGTRVIKTVYTSETASAEVVYYKIVNGGHTWPGGKKYAAERIVGKLCKDIDATRVIWDFFRRHTGR